MRLAPKEAGLDAGSVTAEQMAVVLRKVLPQALVTRGIDDAEGICDALAKAVASAGLDVAAAA